MRPRGESYFRHCAWKTARTTGPWGLYLNAIKQNVVMVQYNMLEETRRNGATDWPAAEARTTSGARTSADSNIVARAPIWPPIRPARWCAQVSSRNNRCLGHIGCRSAARLGLPVNAASRPIYVPLRPCDPGVRPGGRTCERRLSDPIGAAETAQKQPGVTAAGSSRCCLGTLCLSVSWHDPPMVLTMCWSLGPERHCLP